MKKIWLLSFAVLGFVGMANAAEPIKALMITGGCCHDYDQQKKILSEGISARANVTWTIVHEGGGEKEGVKDTMFSIYKKKDWIKDFDIVVHNECSGKVTNVDWVENIAKAHTSSGVPAVVIHCSIHSYREANTDAWRDLLGVKSMRHQARRAFDVVTVQPENPIMKGWPVEWHDESDELYEILKVWPTCTPLAKSITPKKPNDMHPCIWINTDGKCRVFGTTLGHLDTTMQKTEYLDLMTRGLLWACDKLDADGKPKPGYGKK